MGRLVIVTELDEWARLVAGAGAYALPEWVGLWTDQPIGLVGEGRSHGPLAPLVLNRERRVAHSPSGDGGVIGVGSLDAIADALAGDFDTLVVRTDPVYGFGLTAPTRYRYAVEELPPAVVCHVAHWDSLAMSKGHRRDVAKALRQGWSARPVDRSSIADFVAAYAETAERVGFDDGYELTVEHVDRLYDSGLAVVMYAAIGPDGCFGGGVVGVVSPDWVVMHWGVTADCGVDVAAMKLAQVALLTDMCMAGVLFAMDGPGNEAGDALEGFKLRFGSTVLHSWRKYTIDLKGDA